MSIAIKRLPSLSKIAETILDLRTGLGAAKLTSEIKKITLIYSNNDDDKGTRYKWLLTIYPYVKLHTYISNFQFFFQNKEFFGEKICLE